jgi:hypothetical protein
VAMTGPDGPGLHPTIVADPEGNEFCVTIR